MSDTKNSRHHCGKPRDKRHRSSRGGYKSPMMSEKSDAELTSSPASSPALGPTASSQGGGGTRRPSCAGLLTPPPPDEALPPRAQQMLLPQPEQSHVETSVFRLTHPTRQVYPTQGTELQNRPPPPVAAQGRPSPAASERLQCDASKQACLKETDNCAAVTRLDVAMSRLRKIYFGILEEQLLNEALLAAGSDAEEFSVTRGGNAYCCGDRLSPRPSLTSHETAGGGGGGGGSDSGACCVHCGAPAGRHNRVTQTSASDRALLLDVHLLPRLMHAYERNHALIVQDLREALARVEEAAGAGTGAAEGQEATVTANAGAAALAAALRSKTMAAQQPQQATAQSLQQHPASMQPLPTRPDVCPKECSPVRCPLAPGSGSSPADSPVLTHHKHSFHPSSSKDPQRRRRPPTWWRKLLCISTEDDA